MDTDILLFSLDHPDTFLPHLVDNAKDVDNVVFSDSLQDPIKGYEGPTSSNSSTEREFILFVNSYYDILNKKTMINVSLTLGWLYEWCWCQSYLQWTTIGRCSGLTRSLNARTNLLVMMVIIHTMLVLIVEKAMIVVSGLP